MRGLLGAMAATLGIVLPSFVIIYIIAQFLDHFLSYTLVAKAFSGIRIGVGVLILDVGMNMMKKMPQKPLPRAIAGCCFAAMLLINLFSLNFSSITLMLIAGAVSLSVFIAKGAPDMKGGGSK